MSASPPPPAPADAAVGEPTVLTRARLAGAWRRSRRAVVMLLAVGAVLGPVIAGLVNRRWRADSAFLPQASASALPTGIASLAAEFGIAGAQLGNAGESPAFYLALIRSRELLRAVLATPVTGVVRADSAPVAAPDTLPLDRPGTWFARFAPDGGDARHREDRAIETLKRRLALEGDERTGLVRVGVRMETPEEAEALNRRVLDLVNDFNLRRRRSRAATERAFVEDRLAEARRDLRSAEDALRRFAESNSSVERSPRLQLELARLDRQVELAQQLYVTLSQAREQAYIEEVRTTPVVTIVDRPEGAAYRRLGLVPGVIAGLVLGTFASVALVAWRASETA